MNNLIFCLMGPTASGKTALACELVKKYPFEVISVDSAMIYRDMNIGTAKPSKEELEGAPHHLIDILDPIESYSAAQFCADAFSLCTTIIKKGNIPLLVGGTMMYFKALQQGLSILPEANPQLRQQIEEEASQYGWISVHQKLAELDPAAAARIHVHDAQRIQRALEVYYLTGSSMSTLFTEQKKAIPYHFINFVLRPTVRSWLHERIAQRYDLMLQNGLVEEVQELHNKWHIEINFPAMRCVGYRQVLEYLRGDYNYLTMREKGVAATRQLAKRQLTWLRQWNNALNYDVQNKTFSKQIIAKVQEILDNESS